MHHAYLEFVTLYCVSVVGSDREDSKVNIREIYL